MAKLEFKYASVEALTNPSKSGLYECYVDYWWYQVPDKGVVFSRDRSSRNGVHVLCNKDRKIVEMLLQECAPEDEDAEILQLSLAFVPTTYEGVFHLPKEHLFNE